MIVRELIEKLQELNPGARVIVAADPEGNSFDTLWNVQESHILTGDQDLQPLHPRDLAAGEYGDNPDTEEVVVLWP